jgi:hypothetical protein
MIIFCLSFINTTNSQVDLEGLNTAGNLSADYLD